MQSEHYWNEPFRWNGIAEKTGMRRRVFCASMADVFERHPDLDAPRARLWRLIEATPMLDWLLLTKRPENWRGMVPPLWRMAGYWPKNVWFGFTGEDQHWFVTRWEADAKACPAPVRFLSAEPLLGPIKLCRCSFTDYCPVHHPLFRLNWVIVGGESGHGARPMKADWVLDLRHQCQEAGISFFFKQKGEWLARLLGCKDKAGKDRSEWPETFRCQQFPVVA